VSTCNIDRGNQPEICGEKNGEVFHSALHRRWLSERTHKLNEDCFCNRLGTLHCYFVCFYVYVLFIYIYGNALDELVYRFP